MTDTNLGSGAKRIDDSTSQILREAQKGLRAKVLTEEQRLRANTDAQHTAIREANASGKRIDSLNLSQIGAAGIEAAIDRELSK